MRPPKVLFGSDDVDVPVMAMRGLVFDLMSEAEIADSMPVQRRLLFEFRSRLDDRATVDDGSSARSGELLHGLERNFPSLH
jgi:hypothetical protein